MKINDITSTTGVQNAAAAKDKAETGAFEAALKKAASTGDDGALKKACQDFESIFVQMIMKNMHNTVTADPLFEKSQAQSIFEGMLDEELSKKVADANGLGIADLMFQQLKKRYGTPETPAEGPEVKGFDGKG